MRCGQRLDKGLLNPYGIDFSSFNLHFDSKSKAHIIRYSSGSKSERISQISGVIFCAACNFESVHGSSGYESHLTISLTVGNMLVKRPPAVLSQVYSTLDALRAY